MDPGWSPCSLHLLGSHPCGCSSCWKSRAQPKAMAHLSISCVGLMSLVQLPQVAQGLLQVADHLVRRSIGVNILAWGWSAPSGNVHRHRQGSGGQQSRPESKSCELQASSQT